MSSSSSRPLNGTSRPVIVSACLLGRACRYDGRDAFDAMLAARLKGRDVIPVCPEELGGLPTPRPPAELSGGDGADVWCGRARVERITSRDDLTSAFMRGARRTLDAARRGGARLAILKENSPSCGCRQVRCDGLRIPGRGVTAALLSAAGIEVESC